MQVRESLPAETSVLTTMLRRQQNYASAEFCTDGISLVLPVIKPVVKVLMEHDRLNQKYY